MISMAKMVYSDRMNVLTDLADTTMRTLTLDSYSDHRTKCSENFSVSIHHLLIFLVTVSQYNIHQINFGNNFFLKKILIFERFRLRSTQRSSAFTSPEQHIVNIIYESIYGRVIDGWFLWSSSCIKWLFINFIHVVQQRSWQ